MNRYPDLVWRVFDDVRPYIVYPAELEAELRGLIDCSEDISSFVKVLEKKIDEMEEETSATDIRIFHDRLIRVLQEA